MIELFKIIKRMYDPTCVSHFDFIKLSEDSIRTVTFFYRGSEDLCLLRWQNLEICRTRCFGYDIPNGTPRCSVFAEEFAVFVPNAISHYGRPSRFALICFNARRLDDSASLLVPHRLESWIRHPKESELHLSVSLLLYLTNTSSSWLPTYICLVAATTIIRQNLDDEQCNGCRYGRSL